ncbi:hypothetical protein [Polyangium jinanense]|uniref:Uncharacterized protein n=1 Tax=Polyangium jinanense TaxID=2829994 RepID=A0A9X4B0B5_9BACT|nr:hypothetical protein [Polyangium jinanense]MDC3962408.1 hypothetical protein [Polyangium jinanense]MDC3989300.1 hypothetical protein [Polyangium jinanense]
MDLGQITVCGLLEGGDVRCGFFNKVSRCNREKKVPSISGAVAIEASADSMCVFQGPDRHVTCFHDHRFDEDQDFAQQAPRPKATEMDDEHLWCWGHDKGGQLGTGRLAMSYRAVRAEVLR